MHAFHVLGIFAFSCHCVLTFRIPARQRFLYFVNSFSATISVPHRCVYGGSMLLGRLGGLSFGNHPWGFAFGGPILRIIGRPGRSTMASLTTLHIGRPCHTMHSEAPNGPSHLSLRVVVAPGCVGPRPAGHARFPRSSPGRSRGSRRTGRPCALPLTQAHPGLRRRRALPENPARVVVPLWSARPCCCRHPCKAPRCTVPITPDPHPWHQHAAVGFHSPAGATLARPATGDDLARGRPNNCRRIRPPPRFPGVLLPASAPPWVLPMRNLGVSAARRVRAALAPLFLFCTGTKRGLLHSGKSSSVYQPSGRLAFAYKPFAPLAAAC